MKAVDVNLGERAYQIHIGSGLIADAADFIAPLLKRQRVAIVTDENVADLHLNTLVEGLEAAGISTASLTLPAGESTKSWPYFERTVEWLLSKKIERRDVVIALGGGVIGDLVGFAAAVLRRGIRFVQMPTSLLAQVDSSVGGKTGINAPHGKNLIGAFHQPSMVLADIDVLTLLHRVIFWQAMVRLLNTASWAIRRFLNGLRNMAPHLPKAIKRPAPKRSAFPVR